jgi:short subunit dehydrogenase-like uncharacterized protein
VAGRIALFGATGYTGRLVAEALVARGAKPVLAGRSTESLERLAEELGGGLETQRADVAEPATVRALVERGAVLVSTVGPFNRFGDAAVEAAIDAGANYIDSTGESRFIRRVFERYGPDAERAGVGLVTAFGYDFVPGNLAGALALEEAGDRATAVAAGYFLSGGGTKRTDAMSGGTAASAAGMAVDKAYGWRGGRLVDERVAKRVRSFDWNGKALTGCSLGSSEHFALPRLHPGLQDVDVYLGWLGPASRMAQVGSLVTEVPGARSAIRAVLGRFGAKGSSGGPAAEARAKSGSRIVAEASDASGEVLARVLLEGPNGYTFTGDVMAWGAERAAAHGLEGAGALGPVDGFGLRTLEAGCAEVGLRRAPGA